MSRNLTSSSALVPDNSESNAQVHNLDNMSEASKVSFTFEEDDDDVPVHWKPLIKELNHRWNCDTDVEATVAPTEGTSVMEHRKSGPQPSHGVSSSIAVPSVADSQEGVSRPTAISSPGNAVVSNATATPSVSSGDVKTPLENLSLCAETVAIAGHPIGSPTGLFFSPTHMSTASTPHNSYSRSATPIIGPSSTDPSSSVAHLSGPVFPGSGKDMYLTNFITRVSSSPTSHGARHGLSAHYTHTAMSSHARPPLAPVSSFLAQAQANRGPLGPSIAPFSGAFTLSHSAADEHLTHIYARPPTPVPVPVPVPVLAHAPASGTASGASTPTQAHATAGGVGVGVGVGAGATGVEQLSSAIPTTPSGSSQLSTQSSQLSASKAPRASVSSIIVMPADYAGPRSMVIGKPKFSPGIRGVGSPFPESPFPESPSVAHIPLTTAPIAPVAQATTHTAAHTVASTAVTHDEATIRAQAFSTSTSPSTCTSTSAFTAPADDAITSTSASPSASASASASASLSASASASPRMAATPTLPVLCPSTASYTTTDNTGVGLCTRVCAGMSVGVGVGGGVGVGTTDEHSSLVAVLPITVPGTSILSSNVGVSSQSADNYDNQSLLDLPTISQVTMHIVTPSTAPPMAPHAVHASPVNPAALSIATLTLGDHDVSHYAASHATANTDAVYHSHVAGQCADAIYHSNIATDAVYHSNIASQHCTADNVSACTDASYASSATDAMYDEKVATHELRDAGKNTLLSETPQAKKKQSSGRVRSLSMSVSLGMSLAADMRINNTGNHNE